MTPKKIPLKNKPGAGRPNTGHVKRDVAMTPAQWARLDALRGDVPRGAWLAQKLGLL